MKADVGPPSVCGSAAQWNNKPKEANGSQFESPLPVCGTHVDQRRCVRGREQGPELLFSH